MDRKPAPGGLPWLPLPSVIGGAGPGPQPSGCGRDRELVERGGVEAWGRVARDQPFCLLSARTVDDRVGVCVRACAGVCLRICTHPYPTFHASSV